MWLERARFSLRLMLLRSAPQDYPASSQSVLWLAILVLIANAVSITVLEAMIGEAAAERLELRHNFIFQSIFEIIFLVVFIKAMLLLFNFPVRFPQVFCAIAGVNIGFSFLFIPIQYLTITYGLGAGEDMNSGMSPILAIVYIAMFVWLVRAIGNIFMHALELRLSFAVGITLLYMMGKIVLVTIVGNV